MGQRSQIYIRYNVNYENCSGVYNYKGLIARHFGWNYGERMISRARYIIEHIHDDYMKYKWEFGNSEDLEKLKWICNTNFDMKDILFSSNIIEEIKETFDGDMQYLFEQDNNDGQLFIDVTDKGIKYCFMEYYNEGKPMNAEQYMKWNCEDDEHSNWHEPYEYMDKETIAYTEENIRKISKMATLMNDEEIESFVTDDYSYLVDSKEAAVDICQDVLIETHFIDGVTECCGYDFGTDMDKARFCPVCGKKLVR